MNAEPDPRATRHQRPTCDQATALPGPDYQRIKASILATVARLRATNPTAADYLTRHIVFDDARQTVEYTGIAFPDLELN
jgi:hypothetical protein